MLASWHQKLLTKEKLLASTKVWIFSNTSKQNEQTRWILATVLKAGIHIVDGTRFGKGPLFPVAYEHVRPTLKRELANELMNISLEGELSLPVENNTQAEEPQPVHSGNLFVKSLSNDQVPVCNAVKPGYDAQGKCLPNDVPKSSLISAKHNRNALKYIEPRKTLKASDKLEHLRSEEQEVLQRIKKCHWKRSGVME